MVTSTNTTTTNTNLVTSTASNTTISSQTRMSISAVNAISSVPAIASASAPPVQPVPKESSKPSRIDVSFFDRLEIKKIAETRGLNQNYYYFKYDKDDRGKPIRIFSLQPDIQHELNEKLLKISKELSDLKMNPEQFSIENHIKGCIETMIDDKTERMAFMDILKNEDYSKNNLQTMDVCENHNGKLKVSFAKGDLYFSNRMSSFELRGDKLKQLLQDKNFTCMHDFLCQLHMTKDDQFLIAMLQAIIVHHTFGLEKGFLFLLKKELTHLDLFDIPLCDLLPDFFDMKKDL